MPFRVTLPSGAIVEADTAEEVVALQRVLEAKPAKFTQPAPAPKFARKPVGVKVDQWEPKHFEVFVRNVVSSGNVLVELLMVLQKAGRNCTPVYDTTFYLAWLSRMSGLHTRPLTLRLQRLVGGASVLTFDEGLFWKMPSVFRFSDGYGGSVTIDRTFYALLQDVDLSPYMSRCKPTTRKWLLAQQDGEPPDLRPRCFTCKERWLPPEGVDASLVSCPKCRQPSLEVVP